MHKHADEYRNLALNIQKYRKAKGWSTIEFAEKLGLSRTHVSNIEAPNYVKSFSINVLFDIAKVLDVDLSQLFDFTGMEPDTKNK